MFHFQAVPDFRCANCGRAGHTSAQCRLVVGQSGNIAGFVSQVQPNVVQVVHCATCGQRGHTSFECNKNTSSSNTCSCCGGIGHTSRQCPNNRPTCSKCGGVGHTSRVCPS